MLKLDTKFSLIWMLGIVLSVVPLFAVAQDEDDEDKPMIIDKSAPVVNTANTSPKKAGFLEIISRMNQLENEIRQLRGELETAMHDIKAMKHRQKELYADMDRRMREMEAKAKSGVFTPSTASTSTKPTTSYVKPITKFTPNSSSETKEFKAAFAFVRNSRYQEAISAFRGFIAKYPKGNFADAAQYWLAEAYYISRDYRTALAEFNKLVKNHPTSPKVVGSKVKIGFCYYEMKKYSKARRVLKQVVRRHSRHSSARLARYRLKRMNREGR